MKIKDCIRQSADKVKAWMHTTIKQTAPVVQDELAKVTAKLAQTTSQEILDGLLKIAMGGALVYGVYSVWHTAPGASGVFSSVSEPVRDFNVVYNEVKIENLTIYLKGE